jgi:hypothetical protein
MRLLEIVLMTLGGVWQGIRQDFNLLEIALVAGVFWAIKKGWKPGPLALPFPSRPRLPWLIAVSLALGTVALRWALLPRLPHPIPVVADEFSHLLLADTLLHGRFANPTHPFWQFFESIHIIQQPHYASNYFPGHAAVLAVGRIVSGDPWVGVLAECAVFLAALYWMLRGWMPPRWALFGTLLACLRFGIASYWMNSYYGGFLPAAGGALVAGAFPRLRRCPTVAQGCVFGAGLAILVLTRPFEGFFFSLVWTAVLAWEFRKRGSAILKVGIPALALAGLAAAGVGIYLKHVTGSPFVTAYQISEKTYGWPIDLPWTSPPAHIEYRHAELATHYDYELGDHEQVSGPLNFAEYLTFRLQAYWRFFLGPLLTIPLLMAPHVWRRRPMLIIGAAGAIFAILLEGTALPHYLAPATAVFIALIVECCRYLRLSRISWARWLPAAIPVALAAILMVRIGAANLGLPYTQKINYQSWCCQARGNLNKDRIAGALRQIPGRHLVFVKGKTDPYNLLQWIYNDADIDASEIVWARDMGPERNAQLVEYFAGRQLWMVDPNLEPATCRKYSSLTARDANPSASLE